MANGAGAAGGGGMFTGLSDLLAGVGKYLEKNPEGASSMLGQFATAVSGPNSWQGRLGSMSTKMAENEQSRKFLSELLGESRGGQGTGPAGTGASIEVPGESSALKARRATALEQIMGRPYR